MPGDGLADGCGGLVTAGAADLLGTDEEFLTSRLVCRCGAAPFSGPVDGDDERIGSNLLRMFETLTAGTPSDCSGRRGTCDE